MRRNSAAQWSVVLVMVLTVIAGMFSGIPKAAQAAGGWPVNLGMSGQAVRHNRMTSHIDGKVTLSGCDSGSAQDAATSFNVNGTIYGGVPGTDQAYMCSSSGNVNKEGIVYLQKYNNTDPQTMSLVAYKGSKLIWQYQYENTTCGGMTGPSHGNSSVVGSDGNLYILLSDNLCRTYELVSLVSSTGKLRFRKPLSMGGDTGSNTVQAYANGIVIHEFAGVFRYFSYDGKEDVGRKYIMPLKNYDWMGEWVLQLNGDIYATVVHQYDPDVSPRCLQTGHAQQYISRVVKRSFAKKTVSYNMSPYCKMMGDLKATPNGGAVLQTFGIESERGYLLFLDPKASKVLKVMLPHSADVNSFGRAVDLQVDVSGNIFFTRIYYPAVEDGGGDRNIEFIMLNSRGALISRRTTAGMQTKYNDEIFVHSQNVVLSNGSIYASISQFNRPDILVKLSYRGLQIDYPRGALFGVKAKLTTQRDYVALGDSFASGEGTEPFDLKTDLQETATYTPGDGNLCHRSRLAYAHLLDHDPANDLSLKAFAACSGAKTSNVASAGQWNETAQYKKLKTSTDIVTMSIGGNNVGFEGFLMLCLFRDCSKKAENNEFFNAITRKESDLKKAYGAVLAKAPNAKVYITGYPYVLPDARTTCNQTDSSMEGFNFLVGRARVAVSEPLIATPLDFAALVTVKALGKQAGLSSDEVLVFVKSGRFEFNPAEQNAAKRFVDTLNNKLDASVAISAAENAAKTKKPKRLFFVPATGSKSPFHGHELCTEKPYFNGIELRVVRKGVMIKPVISNVLSFHPNAAGQKAYARLIKSKIG